MLSHHHYSHWPSSSFPGRCFLPAFLLFFFNANLSFGIQELRHHPPLDCSFQTDISNCCWHSLNTSLAKIHMQADARWYAKRFRAVGLFLPESAFIALNANGAGDGPTVWESCNFCTSNGDMEITLRHWQSATAELDLCWAFPVDNGQQQGEGGGQLYDGACILMDPRTQFTTEPLALNVPSNTQLKLYFRLRNRSRMRTAVASVLIDYIQVQSEFCSDEDEQPERETMENGREEYDGNNNNSKTITTPLEKDELELSKRMGHTTELELDEANAAKGKADLITYEIEQTNGNEGGGGDNVQMLKEEEESLAPIVAQRAAPIQKFSSGNDVSAEKPSLLLLTNWSEEQKQNRHKNKNGMDGEETELVRKNIKKLDNNNKNRNNGNDGASSSTCRTFGGCSFEHSECGYTNTNSQFSSGNTKFQRKQIGDWHVVQAQISPGEVAVYESATNMTDADYRVVFNHFESATANSQQQQKFSACCYVRGREPSELECPFESANGADSAFMFGAFAGEGGDNTRAAKQSKATTKSKWKLEKIICPVGTSKLMFTCEFYGTGSAICALDSVRLHRIDGTHLHDEPCEPSIDEE